MHIIWTGNSKREGERERAYVKWIDEASFKLFGFHRHETRTWGPILGKRWETEQEDDHQFHILMDVIFHNCLFF